MFKQIRRIIFMFQSFAFSRRFWSLKIFGKNRSISIWLVLLTMFTYKKKLKFSLDLSISDSKRKSETDESKKFMGTAGESRLTIYYRGEGRVCFYPPLLSDQICKIIRPIFRKKCRRRRKNFEVPFFKKLTFLGKFNGC